LFEFSIAVTNISDIVAFLVVLDHVQGSGWIKNGSWQDTGEQKADLVEGQSRGFVFELDAQTYQEMMG
jgi:hypothetical protein